MSRPAWHRGGGVRVAETALWAAAGVLVLATHVGAVAWLMREEPIVAADDAPPAAIMIELAAVPEAIDTDEQEISEEQEDSEASTPAKQVEAPEETPPKEVVEEELEPEPVEEEEIVEQEEDPVEDDVVQLPDAVEVPLPTPRPKPPAPKREVVAKKEEPKKKPVQKRPQKQQSASQTTRKAQAQVQQGNRNAARQTSSGVSKAQQARWQSRLMAHLERRKRYPADARRRGERGIVYVRFRIDDDGNVQSASIARSSGFPALDNEVLSLVRRASPVPKPPPGVNKTITAPVRFSVR